MHIVKIIAPAVLFFFSPTLHSQELRVKDAYAAALLKLVKPLHSLQNKNNSDKDAGALRCVHCNVLHTRAAEAMYPFYVSWKITRNDSFLVAAKHAAQWLMQQQQANGSWKETPEEWTGTTTDQLLMMLLTYEGIQQQLSPQEKTNWTVSMRKAADYLHGVMSPEFASINYVATTTATLAKAGILLKDDRYIAKARSLAHRVASKFDADGFLNGEGGKSHGNKMGVDLGYNMEMSLWGLALYARLTKDQAIDGQVKKAVRTHVNFIYPDGSLDASWGIRSNKWTGYGSGTSDGCQVLFSLYADVDPVYANASLRNLSFIEQNITRSGLLGYGPMHDALFSEPACIYPTFTKAKNIAMAYMFETKNLRVAKPIPSDSAHTLRDFKTVDVALIRTKNMMATVTAYRYKDQLAGSKGKYMFRPGGGTISHLWMKGWGFVQASSPTQYTRPEPMSFPEAPGVLPLTPRIEYSDTAGYFTNLYEFDAHFETERRNGHFYTKAYGELKDKNWLTGGVAYETRYDFSDAGFEKTILLRYHDAWPAVEVIEPFIDAAGTSFVQTDKKSVLIKKGDQVIRIELVSGNAELRVGQDKEHYWAPYPALRAMPIVFHITAPDGKYEETIRYSVTITENSAGKSNTSTRP